MPPFVSRKRQQEDEPTPPSAKRRATPTSKQKAAAKSAKPSLFDAADTPARKPKSAAETKKFLESLDNDEDDESLSDVDSDEFEDVPPAKRQKTATNVQEQEDDSDDDGMDWEDATAQPEASSSKPEPEIGDINVSLNEDGVYEEPEVSLATGKKGPSKRERQFRVLTHSLHVQSLMWHNAVRNSWLNDKELQKILVDGLGDGVKREITRWRENMGTLTKEELQAKKAAAAKLKARKDKNGKGKSKTRDWSYEAEHLEQGVPNLSQGDPLLRLLKVLTAYWRKRFVVTAPAFRKLGYMPLKRLREEIKHWEKSKDDVDEHGERIEDIHAFRKLAKSCEGSRDVGAQLYVALLRGIGLEVRMVANLQPAGTGFSKAEEALEKKSKKTKKEAAKADVVTSDEEAEEKPTKEATAVKKTTAKANGEKPSRTSARGGKGELINLDDSDSALSEPPSDVEAVADDDGDDVSLIDVTPSMPRKKPSKKYDRDLAFPTYWTEVCSPVSHKWIPVDPIVLSTIASTEELLQTFEPRGKKAENSKQVICYTIAHNADGSAKDVTVRYIKKHQLPGKTKGMRILTEKVPIYNKRGKIKKYESYDWFRTVMSSYDRPQIKRTAADDLEEQTDLKPFKPAKEAKEVEKESLQGYKQSAEFVLEQHLRREEAILPGAKPVKTFTAGKGDKAVDCPVYKRSDVVNCKTVESWHKEGRAVKVGEHPMKHVPVRAVTLLRKREMEEHFKEHGEKLQQGLYGWDQTDWIIPPPIENGVIPKNAFGNMDVYVETMVPAGAVHLPLKGSAKICRKLEIDYAEACTGFEFGKQRAVPVLTGVVVAEEHEILVRDAWKEQQKEMKRKEDTKRTAAALHWWRKMVMGMRIVERMRAEYNDTAGDPDAHNPFARKAKAEGRETKFADVEDNPGAGGFFQPGHEEDEVPQHRRNTKTQDHVAEDAGTSGGFFVESEDEAPEHDQEDGGLLVEEDPEGIDTSMQSSVTATTFTPMSLQSVHRANNDIEMDAPDDVETSGGFLRDDAEEDEGRKLAKPKRQSTKATPPAKGRRTSTKFKAAARSSDEDVDSSSSEPEEDVDVQSASVADVPVLHRERSSPQVIISPVKRAGTTGRRPSRGRIAKKATPTKSQYFQHDEDDEDDENQEDESEPEVVKPTRTTARTRSRR
ncbi:Putative DNA repair protein Rad4 [Septoria linicola]|uniref:DNA repair protein Rad4 n=1 Tax=Septoria linicola TaxID=215465 RepID=A0A9Q9AYL5_9PEZI|nr:putative DNA repair protein Rad4 [Septoria linicola]USW54433.1 Putative DNA repair protein Rad4 [Septoria linicola]